MSDDTITVNITSTARAKRYALEFWDGTVHPMDELPLAESPVWMVVKRVYETTVSAAPDCVISVGSA